MTDLQDLHDALLQAAHGGNALDVRLAVDLVPLPDYVSAIRANDAGTKVIRDYKDGSHGTAWAPDYTVRVDDALRVLAAALPDWWVSEMAEDRTPIVCKGDEHKPLESWHVRIQHCRGGRMTEARCATLPLAICAAVVAVKLAEESGRWAA